MYIDTASTSDISALCDLASLLETQEGDFFGRRHQQVRRLGNLLLAKEHALVLCIRDQEEVIAMLTLSSLNPGSDQPAIMRLNDMAVLPAYQGQGAGSMLLQAAINQARQAGWSKIVVHQTDINPTIQQQLSRFGFSPAGQQIQLSLRADKASLSVA
ncbi:GNAT family N-acetyltransferase [Thalassolituus alkanivorans]|jgi:predicted N-acetyltransferase YhbS|uniref:GNAT family N-acetyltransferase n=1 Tax=Thalassolituus alkanivorans TaxID=2881055 RepID=UPI001E3FC0DD|nr:GNAT family N-acetyltransferase [Thalassolituus alkanivorans]MBU2039370.1 GNAT family N-acetyltransferase [Gammaproteobacteria bacterium]MCB2388456.1 GNAT family N-acetyltransferase [Thalassolituus alkanivorans]MCB2423826.1 GNAT family N-acetyltransferase [Thalassolituus alkanivorans]